MAQIWTEQSGKLLATIQETQTTVLSLPISGDYLPLATSGLTIQLISGNLPQGMRLEGSDIVGTPYEVQIDTLSTFVLRATYNNEIYDRTFKVIVQGPDDPSWV